MSEATLPDGFYGSSPFDVLRREDDRGEWWSARDLMEPLDYRRWSNFVDPIERGRIALTVNGQDADTHIRNLPNARKVSRGPSGDDYRLTREGAYAVVQNCDIRKEPVAKAHGYFRTRTIQAENIERALTDREKAVMLARQLVAADEEAQRLAGELHLATGLLALEAPKVAVFDALIETHGWFTMAEVAQMISLNDKGRTTLMQALRDTGLFCKDVEAEGRRPYQKYNKPELFDVRLVARKGNPRVTDTATWVSPKGVDFVFNWLVRKGYDVTRVAR